MPVVIVAPVLVGFAAIITFLILYALRKTAAQWLVALIELLARTTVFGIHIFGWLVHAIERAVYWVENELGRAAEAVARPIGDFFSHVAGIIEYVAFTGAYIAEGTWDALHLLRRVVIPKLIHGLTYPYREAAIGARALSRLVARELHAAEATLEHDFRYAERRAMAAYGAAVAALAHAFGIAIPGALDWTHTTVGSWWGDTMRTLRRRLTRVEEALGAAVFAGLVLRVLARHMPWFRCANVGRTMRQLCRTPYSFLSDLLTLAADFFVLTNICHVIPWLEAAFEEVAAPLIGQLAKVGAGLCGAGYEPAAPLGVPTLHLPPVQGGQLYIA